MTLATLGGGQQLGNGSSEPILGVQPDPTLKTGTATLTVAELLAGIISYTGAGHTLTLPTATEIEAVLTNAKKDSTFDFSVIATTGTATLAVGTGITAVGALTTAASTATRFRLRKTSAVGATPAWSLYRFG